MTKAAKKKSTSPKVVKTTIKPKVPAPSTRVKKSFVKNMSANLIEISTFNTKLKGELLEAHNENKFLNKQMGGLNKEITFLRHRIDFISDQRNEALHNYAGAMAVIRTDEGLNKNTSTSSSEAAFSGQLTPETAGKLIASLKEIFPEKEVSKSDSMH